MKIRKYVISLLNANTGPPQSAFSERRLRINRPTSEATRKERQQYGERHKPLLPRQPLQRLSRLVSGVRFH